MDVGGKRNVKMEGKVQGARGGGDRLSAEGKAHVRRSSDAANVLWWELEEQAAYPCFSVVQT